MRLTTDKEITDRGCTWGDPGTIIPGDEIGYYVLNNDRVVQLSSGRLVAPVARHNGPDWDDFSRYGHAMCYLSDDNGGKWRRSASVLTGEEVGGERVVLQEPGVIELKDGRLMMFCRTDSGCQHLAFSRDAGETWSDLQSSSLLSSCSPASIERIPSTGDLLLVWNNHEGIDPGLQGRRTPFCVAMSRDEGESWDRVKTLEDNPDGWYCYTAVEFIGDHVLLGHCAGDRRETNGLALTRVTRFPVD